MRKAKNFVLFAKISFNWWFLQKTRQIFFFAEENIKNIWLRFQEVDSNILINKIRPHKWFCLVFMYSEKREEHSFCNGLEIVSFCDLFEFIQTTLVLCRMLYSTSAVLFCVNKTRISPWQKSLGLWQPREKNIIFLKSIILQFVLMYHCCYAVTAACWVAGRETRTGSRTFESRRSRCCTAPECRHRPTAGSIWPPAPLFSDLNKVMISRVSIGKHFWNIFLGSLVRVICGLWCG